MAQPKRGSGGKPVGNKGASGIARGGVGGRAAKPGSHRKGAAAGSGGQRKQGLEGRGPTPPAEARKGHPKARRAAAAAKRATEPVRTQRVSVARPVTQDGTVRLPAPVAKRRGLEDSEIVAGRNPVVEALRAKVPASEVLLAEGIDHDERITEALKIADRRQIPVKSLTRAQLDRLCDRAPHQGIALRVPEYSYLHTDDLIARVAEAKEPGLLVALDSVTDPRNLGAIVRSAAAFGAHGVVIPQRRAAGMTTAAWKTSAGAAARIPIASAVNLTRALESFQAAGMIVIGLDVDGEIDLDDLEAAAAPIVLVVGSEDKGLSRLIAKTCDILVRIPTSSAVESLNAGIATAVVLAEVARRRRAEGI